MSSESPNELTHLNERGEARMVDVTAKEITVRSATARSRVVARQRRSAYQPNSAPRTSAAPP